MSLHPDYRFRPFLEIANDLKELCERLDELAKLVANPQTEPSEIPEELQQLDARKETTMTTVSSELLRALGAALRRLVPTVPKVGTA